MDTYLSIPTLVCLNIHDNFKQLQVQTDNKQHVSKGKYFITKIYVCSKDVLLFSNLKWVYWPCWFSPMKRIVDWKLYMILSIIENRLWAGV